MKNKTLPIAVIAFALAILGYAAGTAVRKQPGNSASDTSRPRVAASFYPLYFFASQIAGDKVVVYNITPAGAEPHDYEPTTQDMARIEDSQLVILNGGKLEAWGDKIKDTLRGTGTIIIIVGEAFANRNAAEEGSAARDPHVWLDPLLAKNEADAIAHGLQKADPGNAAYYKARVKELESRLDNLHTKFAAGLSNCQKKDIITSHAAFGYLASRYGLNQIAISGLSPDEEPPPQKLAAVADFVRVRDIKYIFFESLASPKLSETIARETGAQTLVLDPIEGLSDKALAEGKDYFTDMESNLRNLRIALECK